jgi:DNA-binding transcriptional LysR family regulator
MSEILQNLPRVAVFQSVAEHKCYTRAAQVLGISKSTVSREISALEKSLSLKLLHRSSRNVVPTASGEALLEYCKNLVAEYDSLISASEQSAETLAGSLRVSMPGLLAENLFVPHLEVFRHDGNALNIECTVSQDSAWALSQGGDLAFFVSDKPVSADNVEQLAEVEAVACASPEYLERSGHPARPDALLKHNCLVLHSSLYPDANNWVFVDSHRNPYLISVSGNLTIGDGPVLHAALMAGHGIAIMPHYAVQKQLRNGSLERLFPNYAAPPMYVNVEYRREGRQSEKTQRFVAYMRSLLQQHRV